MYENSNDSDQDNQADTTFASMVIVVTIIAVITLGFVGWVRDAAIWYASRCPESAFLAGGLYDSFIYSPFIVGAAAFSAAIGFLTIGNRTLPQNAPIRALPLPPDLSMRQVSYGLFGIAVLCAALVWGVINSSYCVTETSVIVRPLPWAPARTYGVTAIVRAYTTCVRTVSRGSSRTFWVPHYWLLLRDGRWLDVATEHYDEAEGLRNMNRMLHDAHVPLDTSAIGDDCAYHDKELLQGAT